MKKSKMTSCPRELFKSKMEDAWSAEDERPDKMRHSSRRKSSQKRKKGYEKADY